MSQVYQIDDKVVIYNTPSILIWRQKFCNLTNILNIFNQNVHYSNPLKSSKEEFVSSRGVHRTRIPDQLAGPARNRPTRDGPENSDGSAAGYRTQKLTQTGRMAGSLL